MPYSKEIYMMAKDRLAERRRSALRAADYAREQLFSDIPRLREINSELASIGAAVAKAVIKSHGDTIKELSERSLALQSEQEQILADAGISMSVFEPRYTCPKCHDTGYVEKDNSTAVCDCFIKLLSDLNGETLNADLPLEQCTFDNFSLNYYSDDTIGGKNPYSRMAKIFRYCVDYADTFSTDSKNILMRGSTGLGKTHLSLAIANEIIKKGFSVIYVSAPEILSKLEKEHFSYQYDEQEDTFQSLLKCDLLIIDDLGTEFITPFSVSCVYNLFNSRILAGKPLIISTNLTASELVTTYSQRFASRLFGSADKLEFIGEDVRTLKNR